MVLNLFFVTCCWESCPSVLPKQFAKCISTLWGRDIAREDLAERKIYIVTQHLIPNWHKIRELNSLTWRLLYVLTGLSDAVVLKWLPWMTSADNCPVAAL